MVKCLLLLVIAAESARRATAPEGVEFVNEDDARRGLSRLFKEIANPCGANAHKHLHEFGSGNREERDARFARHGAGEQGFAGPRRPHQQYPLGNVSAEPAVALGIPKKGDYLLQFEFGFLNAGDVGEGDFGILLDINLGARFSDRHQPAEALTVRESPPRKTQIR